MLFYDEISVKLILIGVLFRLSFGKLAKISFNLCLNGQQKDDKNQ